MEYRGLGKTDIKVSSVAFGCWSIVGGLNWGNQDKKDSLEALRAAYDGEITLFDTAEIYGSGESERLVGEALADVRDNIVIATKVSPKHFAPGELCRACERSLGNLCTDRIDLYQLHWPNREIPVADTLAILEKLKGEGKIRAYGISNFGPQDLDTCLCAGYPVVSNQIAYSLLFRAIEYDIQPICHREEISILSYSSLMQGLLTGKFATPDDVPAGRARTRHFSGTRPQTRHRENGAETETFAAIARIREIAAELGEVMADVSLAWILAQPGVTSVIAGARNADQARRNAHAADLELPDDVIGRLSQVTEALKHKLGAGADEWEGGEGRIR